MSEWKQTCQMLKIYININHSQNSNSLLPSDKKNSSVSISKYKWQEQHQLLAEWQWHIVWSYAMKVKSLFSTLRRM